MRIVLFGAAGNMGRRIAREALGRGHQITAVVRDPKSFQPYDDRLTVVKGDATDAESVAAVSAGAGGPASSARLMRPCASRDTRSAPPSRRAFPTSTRRVRRLTVPAMPPSII